jgi:PmbA protein
MQDLRDIAERALDLMRRQGFDHAQVGASRALLDEANIAFDRPSLLRSTETLRVALAGIVDGRKASTELAEGDAASLVERVASLFADARSAPRDDAHAVSSGQRARIEQGPQEVDTALLADKLGELLAFRERETPAFALQEGTVAHTRVRSKVLTSGGSDLECALGFQSMTVMGTAREGARSSSFAYTGGQTHDLGAAHAAEHFGIGALLRDTVRQVQARPIGGKFVGEVVLAPSAVADLVGWLLGQLGDVQLIAGSSLYRTSVGARIASPWLTLKSRFDAPGVAALSADAFACPGVDILRDGVLKTLTPSLYASRKTGLAHVPVAAGGGWEIEAGATPREELIGAVDRGALVGRLSMGMPAANGDFSGLIKNSFAIETGRLGPALAETMISGNVARMLLDVQGVSPERIDGGALRLPWLRVGGLHFS